MRIYRVTYAEDCEKCEGIGTTNQWSCIPCNGTGFVHGETDLVGALRDIHERGQMPGHNEAGDHHWDRAW